MLLGAQQATGRTCNATLMHTESFDSKELGNKPHSSSDGSKGQIHGGWSKQSQRSCPGLTQQLVPLCLSACCVAALTSA